MAAKLVLAVGRRPWFLPRWEPPQRCLGVLTTWRLVSPRASDLRESKAEAAMSFITLPEKSYSMFP